MKINGRCRAVRYSESLAYILSKTNPSLLRRRLRLHQLPDGLDERKNLLIVVRHTSFKLGDFPGKFFVLGNGPTQFYKGSYNENAYFYRAR